VTFIQSLHTFAFASIVAIACQSVPPAQDTGGVEAPAPQGVAIDLDRTTYSAGSRVELRITNHTTETLGFNPCTRSIERLLRNAWVSFPEPARVCTMQLYILTPHASRTETTELPASMPRGTYRLVLTFTRESTGPTPPTPGPTIRAVSRGFQVE
jgi:hypothetical protein